MRLNSLLCFALIMVGSIAGFNFAAAQKAVSAAHDFRPPTSSIYLYTDPFKWPVPLGLSAKGEGWSFYSQGVNVINAASETGNETWLATDYGVKSIDKTHGRIRHYTSCDGLAGNKTSAISCDSGGVFCVQELAEGETAKSAFCSYNRKTKRWQVLKRAIHAPLLEVKNIYSSRNYDPGLPVLNSLSAISPTKACFSMSPVPPNQKVLSYVYDRKLGMWEEISVDPIFRKYNPKISILWQEIDQDGVWFGTNAGLLHWQFRVKKWESFLLEQMIYAGVKDEDGSFWLAGYLAADRKALEKQTPPVYFNNPNNKAGSWNLIHFVPKARTCKQYKVTRSNPAFDKVGYSETPSISGVCLSFGKVWLTLAGRGFRSLKASFAYFDSIKEEFVNIPTGSQRVDNIPNEALMQPTLPRGALVVSGMPIRFPGWVCDDYDNQATEAKPIYDANYPDDVHESALDPNRSFWNANDLELVNSDATHPALEKFIMKEVYYPAQLETTAIAAYKNNLYIMTNLGFYSYNLTEKTWKPITLSFQNGIDRYSTVIKTDGESLLVHGGRDTLRYFPLTDLSRVEGTVNGSKMLGRDSSGIWTLSNNNQLYHTNPNSQASDKYALPALPGEISALLPKEKTNSSDSLIPFFYSNGRLWFRFFDLYDNQNAIAGFNPADNSWTEAHIYTYAYSEAAFIPFESGDKTYFPFTREPRAIYSFNSKSGKWSLEVPPVPSIYTDNDLVMISIDEKDAWGCCIGSSVMVHFDRKTGKWEDFSLTPVISSGVSAKIMTQKDDKIYFATYQGTWVFNLTSRDWSQLPGIQVLLLLRGVIGATEKAVWMKASPKGVYTQFLVRFNREKQNWSTWNINELLPKEPPFRQFLPDGESGWILSSSGSLYRLNLKTSQWDNISEKLGQGDGELKFLSMFSSGEWKWFVPRKYNTIMGATSEAELPWLMRYNPNSNRFESYSPQGIDKRTIQVVTQDKRGIWILTPSCLWRLDKSTLKWERVNSPISSPKITKLSGLRIDNRTDDIWLMGEDSAVKFHR